MLEEPQGMAATPLDPLDLLAAKGAAALSPTQAAQNAFTEKVQRDLASTVWADPHCASWYKNEAGRITQNWSGNTITYAAAVSDVKIEDYALV